MISVFICFMLLVEMSWVEYVISGSCCLVMLLIPHINRDEMIQVPRQLNDEKEPIQQQLQYFSSIFENLGLYYEQLSEIQATFLKSMSKALNYTSRKCEYHRDQTFQLRREIYNCIEDHGYEIEKIECKENEEGTHRVVCQVRGIKKKEIKKIIKAINKTNYEFELIKIHHQKWNQDTITIELQTIAQIGVEALSTSCFIREESGDTTVIFKHEQSVYCMLSDGMGSGKEAKRVSMCIGELFQKMVLSGIHLLEAMTCMNQLLQGDAYATCDVCAFDTISKSVIVCKSAASPTYLIRNQELYAIWGNSLPIGIIAHIDIDHIHVQVEKGDWFIMSSDGVGLDEIKEWMRGLTGLSVDEETLRFNQILKKKKREDDSTVLIAKIV